MPLPEAVRFLHAKYHHERQQRAPQRSQPIAHRAATAALLALPAGGIGKDTPGANGVLAPGEVEPDNSSPAHAGLSPNEEPSQNLPELRRAGRPEDPSCEILAHMESPGLANDAESDTQATPPDGLSAFAARVLDQLALSAWLPAAFLTASIAVLLQFRSTKSASLVEAVQRLTAHPIQVLVIIIPLLVIATVVTQAFSFESIKTLEGYWGGYRLADAAREILIRRHVHRKKSTMERLRKESRKALDVAMPKMLMAGIPFPVVKTLETRISGGTAPDLSSEQEEILSRIDWRPWCNAWRLAKVTNLINGLSRYPVDHRIMPTRLGNLMRATEDRLKHADGDVQSFAHRRRDAVSHRVRRQHDQFRTRLEMYCTLVLVSGSLAFFTPIILAGRIDTTGIVVTFTGFAAMGIVSYFAAIASADGYCGILKQMDEAP